MIEPFQLQGNLLHIRDWEEKFPLKAGFTTARHDSNIAYHVGDIPERVYQNREAVAHAIGMPLNNWVFAQQLHTANVHEVTKADLGAGQFSFESGIPNTDGLYTKEAGVVLATFYADCTPLYFYAPKHHLIGVAHAGWQGTVKDMMGTMLRTFKVKEGIAPEDIYIAIGPAIGQDAYRVDDRVIEQVKEPSTYVDLGGGQYKFNPKKLNVLQALGEGVPRENIVISSYCTFTDKDLFYSHRRDSKSGRMMAFMVLDK